MKILKLLSKLNLSIFIISILLIYSDLLAEDEPVDIWDLEKKIEKKSTEEILESEDISNVSINLENKSLDINKNIVNTVEIDENRIDIVGIYDPEENGLNMNIWSTSNGNEIKLILNKLKKTNLSKDAKRVLDIALLTNSYFPKENITEEEFINFKLDYLINNNDKSLIKLYLLKNENNAYNSKLIKYYINFYFLN